MEMEVTIMGIQISEGCIVKTKDHDGPLSHNYVVLSVPQVPFKRGEFTLTMSITSMSNADIEGQIPVICNNAIGFIVPFAIHSFNYNSLDPRELKGFATPPFISWLDFKQLLLDSFMSYINPTKENIDDINRRISEYTQKFNEFFHDKVEYREIKAKRESTLSLLRKEEDEDPESQPVVEKVEKKKDDTLLKIPEKIPDSSFNPYTAFSYKDRTYEKAEKGVKITGRYGDKQVVAPIYKKEEKEEEGLPEPEDLSISKTKRRYGKNLIKSSFSAEDQIRQLGNLLAKYKSVRQWTPDIVVTYCHIYDNNDVDKMVAILKIDKQKLYNLKYRCKKKMEKENIKAI